MSRNKMNGNPIPKRGYRAALKLFQDREAANLWKQIADSLEDEIQTGDKVMLNVEQIERRRDYDGTTQGYKDFVHENAGRVFTAYIRPDKLASLNEDGSGWLFWRGDLTRIKQ